MNGLLTVLSAQFLPFV